MLMRRLIGALLLVTFLNGCAQLPLVSTLESTLTVNGAIAGATGKYEAQALNATINLASHKSTGKTINQHLYAAVENKYTKKRLEKHFKNKELSVTNFEIANTSIGDYFPTKKTFSFLTRNTHNVTHKVSHKIKWEGFNYRVYDKHQPNFDIN